MLDLTGLDNVASIGGDFELGENDSLTTLAGLEALTRIGGELWFHDHIRLPSLEGLEALETIGGDFYLMFNDALTSLQGLETLTTISGANKVISYNAAFDCTPYNQQPPAFFPLTQSGQNAVDCIIP